MNARLEQNEKYGKLQSLGICAMAYVLAYLVAVMAFRQFFYLGDIYGILVADIAATLVIFFLGLIVRNASLYDPYWSVVPLGIAGYWWSLTDYDTLELRKLLVMIVLVCWAVRLTLNWARSWPGLVHEDWRYAMLREKSKSLYPLVNLGGIHLLPTLLVFLAMLPIYFVLSRVGEYNPILDGIAFAVGLVAVAIELIADEQLKSFVKTNKDSALFLKTGLWRFSRHPNYFGEVLFWLSLFLFAYSASPAYLWTGVGVIAMLALFLFGSIPMMDRRMLKRRRDYADYMKKTSGFFLFPPKLSSGKGPKK